jgi:hypothetical protein
MERKKGVGEGKRKIILLSHTSYEYSSEVEIN